MKVIGPTLGAVVGIATAIVAYPVGALTWCVDRYAGRRVMRAPINAYMGTKTCIPI